MDDDLIQLMASRGRAPSIGYGRGGPFIRGFRSRPGAPQSDRDRMTGLGIGRAPWQDQIGGLSTKGNWNDFFEGSHSSFEAQNRGGPQPASKVITDNPDPVLDLQGVNDQGAEIGGSKAAQNSINSLLAEWGMPAIGQGKQSPGGMPPGVSLDSMTAQPGSTAFNIEDFYRTPGSQPGRLSFGGNRTAANDYSSDLPY